MYTVASSSVIVNPAFVALPTWNFCAVELAAVSITVNFPTGLDVPIPKFCPLLK